MIYQHSDMKMKRLIIPPKHTCEHLFSALWNKVAFARKQARIKAKPASKRKKIKR